MPSSKRIREAFPQVSEADAKKLSAMMRKTAGGGQSVEDTLEFANDLLGGHGVESIKSELADRPGGYWMESQGAYVNMGDTYDVTILHDNLAGEYLVTSWGDWFEDLEAEFADEEEEEA